MIVHVYSREPSRTLLFPTSHFFSGLDAVLALLIESPGEEGPLLTRFEGGDVVVVDDDDEEADDDVLDAAAAVVVATAWISGLGFPLILLPFPNPSSLSLLSSSSSSSSKS